MKLSTIIGVICGTIFLLTQTAIAQVQHQEFVVPLSEPGKKGKLYVDIRSGTIHVEAHSGKEVLVTLDQIESKVKDKDKHVHVHVDVKIDGDGNRTRTRTRNDGEEDGKDDTEGLKKIPSNNVDVSIQESGNKVSIHSDSWNNRVAIHVKVPTSFDLNLNTYNHGSVTVENVSGEMEVESYNGPITLTNVSGSAVASTYNGRIVADFQRVTPNKSMAFTTYNGKVDVTFPPGLKATPRMKSQNGDVYTDFDMTIRKTEPKTTKNQESGGMTIKIEKWVVGDLNGGGPEIMMKNYNGNIYVRKGK